MANMGLRKAGKQAKQMEKGLCNLVIGVQ